MPNEDKRLQGLTQEEADERDEKFRTFFSTSVAQVPEAMSRRQEEEPRRGFLEKLFRRGKKEEEPVQEPAAPLEMPTGEIRLDGKPEELQAGLELALHEAEKILAPVREADEPAAPEKEEREAEKDLPPVPAASPGPVVAAPKKQPKKPENAAGAVARPRAAVPRSPQEQREDEEMEELKAMLFGRPKLPEQPKKPTAKRSAEQTKPIPAPVVPEKGLVFAEEKPVPEKEPAPAEPPKAPPVPEAPVIRMEAEEAPAFRFFGSGEDELTAPARSTAPSMEESMSLPLLEPEAEPPVAAPQPEVQPVQAAPDAGAEPVAETPEQVGETLRHMGAALTLRCVLGGVLAVVLLHFGLVAEGLLAPIGILDPAVAPAAFYAANLLFLLAEMAAAFPVLRDGLKGLAGRASMDTMPALAACAALLQAVAALLQAQNYQRSDFTLLSGVAALGLFLALLGSRMLLASVQGGYELAVQAAEHTGAYRVRDREIIRALSRSLDQKDPWILLNRPTEWNEALIDQCFGERAGEHRSRKTAYILLGVSVLSGLAFLLFGGGVGGGAAAMTAVLCMGAPLSSTLIVGVSSLRLQRTAAAAGAVVPGWAAVEELGGVDTVQVGADELFTPDSATLEDIRIFKGGRIDHAILYSASVLGQSCNTLRGLFRQIIEDRTDILYPVKDLEIHQGLGFAAWCDNSRVLIGTRAYMQREGIPLPEKEYEDKHSKDGALQILYLAVSGSLHAMFVLRYVGGRNTARGLEALQKENIRLLVSCEDPSLTARHIADAYHLPEGMVTLLDQEQCTALEQADCAAVSRNGICCILSLNGFNSLSGGLRAAEQAQNAETSATTVQLVSVWFSVVIAVLLTYAGSVGMLSSAVVLMYQAAWSGLSLAVCALKQHN